MVKAFAIGRGLSPRAGPSGRWEASDGGNNRGVKRDELYGEHGAHGRPWAEAVRDTTTPDHNDPRLATRQDPTSTVVRNVSVQPQP